MKPITISGTQFSSEDFLLIAGPCSIEGPEQLLETATGVRSSGANLLRGGIWKMRTEPESFQGLGENAFSFIKDICKQVGLQLTSEITDPRQLGDLEDLIGVYQVGSRNMYNYTLLQELGQTSKPVILKRGFSATIHEWVKAAEYIIKAGNPNVILCERGIRSFDNTTRNVLDLAAVAYLKHHTELPVIVDPSHGTGRRELIADMSRAAVACGADGLLIEVHPRPDQALSDGFQSLDLQQFNELSESLIPLLSMMNKRLWSPDGSIN